MRSLYTDDIYGIYVYIIGTRSKLTILDKKYFK